MRKDEILHIISESYPFGHDEQFFHLEVLCLATQFDKVIIYPLAIPKESIIDRDLPHNVSVSNVFNANHENMKWYAFILEATKLLVKELIGAKNRFAFANFRMLLSYLRNSYYLASLFDAGINKKANNYYYSFWLNKGALIFLILSRQNKLVGFDARVNGHDIYNDRYPGNYIPFSYILRRAVRKIFVLSTPALNYLKKGNTVDENKLLLMPYGVNECPLNKSEKDCIRIVSCSYMRPIKRLDRIIAALKIIEVEIEWVHFGGGPLFEEFKALVHDLPSNVSVVLKGNCSNEKILQYYKEKPVDAFVHTSESEGFGMSILEAQAFGIPAVVYGVGGVVDIVSSETGIVLSEKASVSDLAQSILEIKTIFWQESASRKKIQKVIYQKFSSEKVYQNLTKVLYSQING